MLIPIVARCLAPDPALRYQTAEELQEDLGNHLNSLPLKHAPNRSLAERSRKWIRRHPRLTSSSTVALFGAVLLSALAVLVVSRGKTISQHEANLTFQEFHDSAAEIVPTLSISSNPDLVSIGLQEAEATLAVYGTSNKGWRAQPAIRRLDEVRQEQLFATVQKLQYVVANAALRRADLSDEADRVELLQLAHRHNQGARELSDADESTPHAILVQSANIADAQGNLNDASSLSVTTKLGLLDDSNSKLMSAIHHMGEFKYRSARRILLELNEESPADYVVRLLLGNCHYALTNSTWQNLATALVLLCDQTTTSRTYIEVRHVFGRSDSLMPIQTLGKFFSFVPVVLLR